MTQIAQAQFNPQLALRPVWKGSRESGRFILRQTGTRFLIQPTVTGNGYEVRVDGFHLCQRENRRRAFEAVETYARWLLAYRI
jgi:hypothetical protein